ncbi:hypothetical protein TIFTF001_033878 [Ficus carica]|uniref:Retrotransposon gag domain-containing protein n=1 Tax=Ficus carica TaxID=3494 RepID=A0AA88DYW5_FICCA|nr:hypothetical protein TIFTF001_033878 [Ficus carica]
MKPPEFERSTNPLVAEEWLTSLQIVLNFMDLTDQEKVFCASYVMKKDARYWWETVQMRRNVLEMTWNDFIQEFNDKLYNRMAMKAQQNEFKNIKQGTMSVTEVVRKFDQLARLCPHLVPTEDERVRRMLDMFHPEIAVIIDSGEKPPTTVAECVERALRAEYRLAQAKQERAKFFEEKKKENQGRLEAPPGPNTHIFAYTRNNVEVGTSNVMTGQLSVANQDTHVLFDSGVIYSFT